MTTWADVDPGDLVIGKNDSLWAVEDIDHTTGKVVLRNATTDRLVEQVVPLTNAVGISVRRDEQMDAAVALTKVYLRGEEIARRNEDGRVMTPPVFVHPGSVLSHLYVFHNRPLPFDSPSLEALIAEHHAMHERGLSISEDHVHDPRWNDDRARVGDQA